MELTGEMHGMAGLDQGAGVDVVPSFALSQRDRFAADGASLVSKPSLDVFWRITPSLSSALTLNTDFSATDVDDRQVNLTRFSLFFPEKRDFFLEDSEVFEFGGLAQNGRPFFSRTIGLSATGQPIDLDGGLRLSGKLGRYTLGMLAVRQEAAGALDAQDVFVGRAYMGFGEQSTVGGIVTFGDPASGRDNHVVGADLLLRDQLLLDGALLEARAWAQLSGGDPARAGAGDERAWGASMRCSATRGSATRSGRRWASSTARASARPSRARSIATVSRQAAGCAAGRAASSGPRSPAPTAVSRAASSR
jgi:hypothetical protein